ncbi:MAG: outer membrane beta-barrel protein [Cyclobacteriaceae bacterium]|nr:outer membrane beta-barrel protein [Cyclobacteriaceae bacterium]
MKKGVLLFLTILVYTTATYANDPEADVLKDGKQKIIQENQGRPDLPGDFMIGLGVSIWNGRPDGMGQSIWGSRMMSLHYMRKLNVLEESKFSVHTGLGFSFERYALRKPSTTIGYQDADGGGQEVAIQPLFELYPNAQRIRKSKIPMNYFEIPLELRWRSNRYDPKRSLVITAGTRVGYLFSTHTKVKYTEGGQNKVSKQKERFDQNQFRISAYGKVGFGNFGLFYNYVFTPQFEKGKGPAETEMAPMMIGISFALF